jgi:hypothetical protein
VDDEGRLEAYLLQLEQGCGCVSGDEEGFTGAGFAAAREGLNMESWLDDNQGGGGDINLSKNRNKDEVSYATKTKEMRYTVSDKEFREMVRKLNVEQRVHFYHLMHQIKHSSEPFYEFLTGGAGVGKGVETRAIAQAVMRWANGLPDSDEECSKVLLMAYTNKASANVDGVTPFSGLGIPTKESYTDMKPLADANGN